MILSGIAGDGTGVPVPCVLGAAAFLRCVYQISHWSYGSQHRHSLDGDKQHV